MRGLEVFGDAAFARAHVTCQTNDEFVHHALL